MIVLRTFLSLALGILFSGTGNFRGYAADEIKRWRNRLAGIFPPLRKGADRHIEVLLLGGYLLAGLLFGASMVKPDIAFSGMVSVLSACLALRFVFTDASCLPPGSAACNPLAVGLALGYFFSINAVTILFIACAGILTLMLTFACHRYLQYTQPEC